MDKFDFEVNHVPEIETDYIPPKINPLLPEPTGFRWTLPQEYIDAGKDLEQVSFIHKGLKTTLSKQQSYRWHVIYTWILHYGQADFPHDFYEIQKTMLAHIIFFGWVVDEVFRGAGKTFLANHYIAFCICEDPDIRLFIVSEEAKKAVARVMSVRNIVTSTIVVVDYGFLIAQSSKKKKAIDRTSSFQCIRNTGGHEPTLKAMSWRDQQMQGDHYHGGIFDDVWSVQLEGEKDAKKKFLAWYGSFSKTLEKCDWFIMLRTRKGVTDLYYELDKLKEWTKFTTKLVHKWPAKESYKLIVDPVSDKYDIEITNLRLFYDHLLYGENSKEISNDIVSLSDEELYDKCLSRGICKTMLKFKWFSGKAVPIIRKFIEKKFKKLIDKKGIEYEINFPKYSIFSAIIENRKNPMSFAAEMQNQPFLPEGNIFKKKYMKIYNSLNVSNDPIVAGFFKQGVAKGNTILMMDPARGTSTTSDYNVILAMSKYRGRYFIRKAWVGKWGGHERRKYMMEARDSFPGAIMYVEADFGQLKLLKELVGPIAGLTLRPYLSKGKGVDYKGYFKGMDEVKADKAAKCGKIYDNIYVPWIDEKIYINSELMMFSAEDNPEGLENQLLTFPKCEKIDYLDTAAMGVDVLKTRATGGRIRVAAC